MLGDQGRPQPQAANLTSRGNLVAVISNGTAVLGLGNIGVLAGKPVMEGKGRPVSKFAGIDVFDIEVDETDPEKIVDMIASPAHLRRHQPWRISRLLSASLSRRRCASA